VLGATAADMAAVFDDFFLDVVLGGFWSRAEGFSQTKQ